jgi:hypothetical protein
MSQEQACEISFILDNAWSFYELNGETYTKCIQVKGNRQSQQNHQAQLGLPCLKKTRQNLEIDAKIPI